MILSVSVCRAPTTPIAPSDPPTPTGTVMRFIRAAMLFRRPPPPPPITTQTSDNGFDDKALALAIIGIFPALAVMWAVVTRSKTVAAFAQLGALHARDTVDEASQNKQTSQLAKEVKLHDQACFTLGVLNVSLTCYVVGAAPQLFYLWHTLKSISLTTLRWYTFRYEGKHFLLLDFCYFANALSLIYLWAAPNSARAFQVLFMVSNGPLAWSVLTFSQSLVFHSHAHMTSVFIHVSPMLLTHALRWASPGSHGFAICEDSCGSISPLTLVSDATLLFYIPWIGLYYIVTFLVLGDYLKSNRYQTLYDRVTTSGPAAKVMSKGFALTGATHELSKRAVYMGSHLLFGVLTMALATLHWHSFAAHSLFALAICSASAWNASSYYFTHFATKYEAGIADQVRRASVMHAKGQ